ncbi:MAG: flagellar biosynthesis protein FlhB [Pseudomonadota bacterium]
MSEEPDKSSKTEDPTAKRMNDALDDGNVPMSREASIFASMLGIVVVSIALMSFGVQQVVALLRQFLDRPEQWRLTNNVDTLAVFYTVLLQCLWLILPAAFVLMIFGVSASLMQSQPRLVPKRIKPDLSRLSLQKGWGRIFGQKGLFEFFKAFCKFATLSVVGGILIYENRFSIFNMIHTQPSAHLEIVHQLANSLIIGVLIPFLAIVALDISWTQYTWRTDLRMTKQQVKDEQKQMEGDPIVKSRIRSMIYDLSRKRMISSVPRATMVIVNPTHYAVALRYVKKETEAPLVLAKGKNAIALKIKEIALRDGIAVIEDKALARSLYDAVDIDQSLPVEFYEAIAEIVLMLSKKRPHGVVTNNWAS